MDEIERVIALVDSFSDSDGAKVEMKFCFQSQSMCEKFFLKIAESVADQDLIQPQQRNGIFFCGLRVLMLRDVDAMRSLCHRYRAIALDFEGEPQNWSVRLKV